jgi:hypothetical protein
MTDLTPNDLSHLNDAEFNSLCPQGYHAPGLAMTDLSPQAQAVWNAFLTHSEWEVTPSELTGLAAALRAASKFVSAIEVEAGDELLAIAAELEGKGNG